MATSSFPWNQVNTMVQDYIIPTIADQIYLSNAALYRMKGKQKTFTGGRRIVVPLTWRTQGGIKWFNGADVFAPTVRDPFQAAEFTPKNANVDLTIDWEEEMQVSGPNQVMDLMEAKGEAARATFFDGMATDIYNTGTDPKALGGLGKALKSFTSTAPGVLGADTYGGISRQGRYDGSGGGTQTNNWWIHQGDNTSFATGGSSTFGGNNFGGPSKMFAQIKLASGKSPTLILSNVGAWTDAHMNLVKNERYVRPQQNSELAKVGFENFMFRSATWVADEKCPRDSSKIETVYYLHEPAVKLYVDSRANFAFEPFRKPHNQMVRTAYILWRGELIVSEPRSCGVQSNVDASSVS